jgi:hypothetical protein
MQADENFRVYKYVCDALTKNPELLGWVIKGLTDGMALSVEQARRDQVDWEVVASMAMNEQLLHKNGLFLADKIEALKPRSSLKWDWCIDKLRGIVTKKQGKE